MKKLLLLISILFISCVAENDQANKDTIVINLSADLEDNNLESDYKISNFIESVDYVLLETADNCILGAYITKIHFTNDRIFVMDSGEAGSNLCIFDNNGKFISKVSSKGRAKNEYLSLANVMFDDLNKELLIYSAADERILYFDFQGNFIKDLQLDEGGIIRNIELLPDGGFICYTPEIPQKLMTAPTGLWRLDASGKYVRSYLEVFDNAHEYIQIGEFPYDRINKLSNGDIVISDGFFSDLYYYDAAKDTLRDFVDYRIDGFEKYFKETTKSNFAKVYESKRFYNILNTAQVKGRYMFNHWNYPNMGSIYNFENNTTVFVNGLDFNYDLPVVKGKSLSVNNLEDAYVVAVTGFEVSEYLRSDQVSNSIKDVIKSKFGGMSMENIEMSNPLLQIMRVKK